MIFSLETASDYMKNDRAIMYGFKCLVIGYDWITSGNGLKNLEIELSFLGGACAASLMKRNLALPPVSSMYHSSIYNSKYIQLYLASVPLFNEFLHILSDEEVEEDLELMQEAAKRIFSMHSTLLGRGFALASPPTVSQALDGVLPFR